MKTESLTQLTMLNAFRAKDSSFDGLFVVTVKTTGIYCRPSCRVRPPLEKNISFLPSAIDAEQAGFRACKRCHPQVAALPTPLLVKRLIDLAEMRNEPLREADLTQVGIDPTTARRQFQMHLGMSFAKYQRNRRLAAATQAMQKGSSKIMPSRPRVLSRHLVSAMRWPSLSVRRAKQKTRNCFTPTASTRHWGRC